MGGQQPLVAARHHEVAHLARHRHHAGRVGGVDGETRAGRVGDVGAARQVEPLAGQIAHLAHQDQPGAPVDAGREIVEREVVGAGAHARGARRPARAASRPGRSTTGTRDPRRPRCRPRATPPSAPPGSGPRRSGPGRPAPPAATPSTRAARARARSPIANISSRPAMPPLFSAPNRSQAAVCDRSQGASPPVQRCATPSSPTNSRLSMSATVVLLGLTRCSLASGEASNYPVRFTRVAPAARSRRAARRGNPRVSRALRRAAPAPALAPGLRTALPMPSASQRSKTTWSPWAREYARTPERYVFGTAPSDFALEVARLVRPGDYVLDLGCGEGRDSVFFAERGAVVSGVDLGRDGLDKARRLARRRGVRVRWIARARDRACCPTGPFDLIFSCGSLHYVAARRARRSVRAPRAR